MHSRDRELELCQENVARLERENEHLRVSAGAFGQLAERLNEALRDERRALGDRRSAQRATPSRRA
jgi:hypothetical protein